MILTVSSPGYVSHIRLTKKAMIRQMLIPRNIAPDEDHDTTSIPPLTGESP